MINLEKTKYEKYPPPLFLRRTAPALYFYPFFLLFLIRPSGGGPQNLLPPFKKVGGRSKLCRTPPF